MTYIRMRRPFARCLCGLRVTLHYHKGRKLSCAEACDLHRYTSIRFKPLRELMIRSIEEGRS